MKLIILPSLLAVALLAGCASDYQSTGVGFRSNGARFQSGEAVPPEDYDYPVTASDPPPTYTPPDTSAQDTIDRVNQQMAMDAANAAAQQQFLDGMAAAQQTMNQANN